MTISTGELREAALSIQVRADCGPGSFWSAVADLLDEVADDRHPSLPAWVEAGALAIARAYLNREVTRG